MKADNIRQFAAFQLYDMFGGQQVISGNPALFCLLRTSPDGQARVLCLHNISDQPQQFTIDPAAPDLSGAWRDILSGSNEVITIDGGSGVSLSPYEVKWLLAA